MSGEKDSVDELVGALIIRRRDYLQRTKNAVADGMGDTAGYVGAVEGGLVDPSLRWLMRYAEALGMELTWTLKGKSR